MSEVIDLPNKISAAKGPEFTEGLVVGINLTTPAKPEESEEEPSKSEWK